MIGDIASGLGLVAAAVLAAYAIVTPPSRRRSVAMALALALAPVLVLGDQWDSAQIADLRESPARLGLAAFAGALVVGAIAWVVRRSPWLLGVLVVAALPFRVPLEGGGEQANLLLPLYVVIAGGVLATVLAERRDPARAAAGPWEGVAAVTWLRRALAAFVVLYALQALYSEDASRGLQNVCFFFVPFSLVYALLASLRWDRRLLVACGAVVAVEAVVFALVGIGQYATGELLWNDQVMLANDFHSYFRVNSLFWDPNILGRYLALAIVVGVAVLLWARSAPLAIGLTAAAAVGTVALAMTFSQSSFAALLAGLAALAALRWSMRITVGVCTVMVLAGLAAGLAGGAIDLSTSNRVNKDTGGRASLVSGGAELFGDRPVWGYGSGSFSEAFEDRIVEGPALVSESHTEPVTVAAEQGIVGLAAYFALVAAGLWVLLAGMRRLMPGLGSEALPDAASAREVAAAAICAAMVALLVHTISYAGFFEDPITWVLLAAGSVLALARAEAQPPPDVARDPL